MPLQCCCPLRCRTSHMGQVIAGSTHSQRALYGHVLRTGDALISSTREAAMPLLGPSFFRWCMTDLAVLAMVKLKLDLADPLAATVFRSAARRRRWQKKLRRHRQVWQCRVSRRPRRAFFPPFTS